MNEHSQETYPRMMPESTENSHVHGPSPAPPLNPQSTTNDEPYMEHSMPREMWYSNDSKSAMAPKIVDTILKCAHRLRGLLASHFSEFDLTDIRYAVLKFVQSKECVGCSQADLAEEFQQSESSISTLINRMRNSGLLFRLRSKTDQRKWVLILSEHGRSLLEHVDECHAQRMAHLFQKMSVQEMTTISDLLSQLVQTLAVAKFPKLEKKAAVATIDAAAMETKSRTHDEFPAHRPATKNWKPAA